MLNTSRALLVALVSAALLAIGLTTPAEAASVSTTKTHAVEKSADDQLDAVNAKKPRKPGSGGQRIDFHWWGLDHNFGPVGTNKVLSILNAGGGVFGIIAALLRGHHSRHALRVCIRRGGGARGDRGRC